MTLQADDLNEDCFELCSVSYFSVVYEKWLFARRYEYCVWVLQQFVIALSACFEDLLELARVVTDRILIHVCQSRVL